MPAWVVAFGVTLGYLLVSLVFLILRKREPQMRRPLRIGGRGNGGLIIGGAAVVLCGGLLSLYLPGMPAFLDVQPWILFGAWWLLGVFFLLRIPAGVLPGEDAEHRLLATLKQRR